MPPKVTNVRFITTVSQDFWQDTDKSGYLVGFDGHSLTIAYGGRMREVTTVLEKNPDSVKVCRFGRDNVFTWSMDGKLLLFRDVALQETHRLRRLRGKPSALEPGRLVLPDPAPLSQERISQVRKELSSRMQTDQESLRLPSGQEGLGENVLPWLETRSDQSPKASSGGADFRFAATVTANTEYIRKLLAEVGWIDVGRFGYSTSKAAFLLVQHSWEAPLMSAVLPHLKQDVDAGRIEADTYALLFDRLQLSLGRRQRYGSQVANDETGALVVLPVEDPSKVDSLRAGLGMIPLKRYVEVFGASEVRFSRACQGAP